MAATQTTQILGCVFRSNFKHRFLIVVTVCARAHTNKSSTDYDFISSSFLNIKFRAVNTSDFLLLSIIVAKRLHNDVFIESSLTFKIIVFCEMKQNGSGPSELVNSYIFFYFFFFFFLFLFFSLMAGGSQSHCHQLHHCHLLHAQNSKTEIIY